MEALHSKEIDSKGEMESKPDSEEDTENRGFRHSSTASDERNLAVSANGTELVKDEPLHMLLNQGTYNSQALY
jgi:hypothetical protein